MKAGGRLARKMTPGNFSIRKIFLRMAVRQTKISK